MRKYAKNFLKENVSLWGKKFCGGKNICGGEKTFCDQKKNVISIKSTECHFVRMKIPLLFLFSPRTNQQIPQKCALKSIKLTLYAQDMHKKMGNACQKGSSLRKFYDSEK